MFKEQITITAADGFRLSALYLAPENRSRGTIVISPAAGVKKEYYLNFSRYLNQQHFAVLTFDYRGIGGSVKEHIKKSPIRIHEWGTKDIAAVIHFLVT